MGTRILGGIAGWLLGVVPLVAVNVVDYFGVYYFPNPFLVGAIALLAGLLLGGGAAGLIGGRSERTGGGAMGAVTTGLVAAVLYAVSVIGFMEVARTFDALPLALTEHPIRASLGIVFLAALLLLVAYVAGALAGKAAPESTAGAPRPVQPAQAMRPASVPNAQRMPGMPSTSRPGGQGYGAPPYVPGRFGDAAAPSRPAGARPNGPSGPGGPGWQAPDASDPRYAGARVYGPPSPSRPAGLRQDRAPDSTSRWQ